MGKLNFTTEQLNKLLSEVANVVLSEDGSVDTLVSNAALSALDERVVSIENKLGINMSEFTPSEIESIAGTADATDESSLI